MPGSPVLGTRHPARWQRIVGWLPVALLMAGVSNHYWLASRHQISPWLGAGFGMFASTDMPSARHVHVIVRLADGSQQEVALGKAYQDALMRARGLPSEARLRHAAETAFQALQAAPEIDFPAAPRALRIEVWRTSYAADTYAAAPVASFGWLLLSMGVTQSEKAPTVRYGYLAAFVVLVVYYEVPWAEVLVDSFALG